MMAATRDEARTPSRAGSTPFDFRLPAEWRGDAHPRPSPAPSVRAREPVRRLHAAPVLREARHERPNHHRWKRGGRPRRVPRRRSRRDLPFGLGDQAKCPTWFVDAIGIEYDKVVELGAKGIGEWPNEGFPFEKSLALRDGKFVGLPIDEGNQANLTVAVIQTRYDRVRPAFTD